MFEERSKQEQAERHAEYVARGRRGYQTRLRNQAARLTAGTTDAPAQPERCARDPMRITVIEGATRADVCAILRSMKVT